MPRCWNWKTGWTQNPLSQKDVWVQLPPAAPKMENPSFYPGFLFFDAPYRVSTNSYFLLPKPNSLPYFKKIN
jgi:hypothetical protein